MEGERFRNMGMIFDAICLMHAGSTCGWHNSFFVLFGGRPGLSLWGEVRSVC